MPRRRPPTRAQGRPRRTAFRISRRPLAPPRPGDSDGCWGAEHRLGRPAFAWLEVPRIMWRGYMPRSFARRAWSLSCSLLVSVSTVAAAQEAEDPALPDLPELPVDE